MSTQDHIAGDLPDDVYGSADANPSNLKRLRVTVTTHDTTGSVLLHAHIGGIYLADWQVVHVLLLKQLFTLFSLGNVMLPLQKYRALLTDQNKQTARFPEPQG